MPNIWGSSIIQITQGGGIVIKMIEGAQKFLKDNSLLILAGSALNLIMTTTKYVQGPAAKVWTIAGVVGLAAGGYGLMLNQQQDKQAMYTAYPSFYPYPYDPTIRRRGYRY